MAWFQLQPRQQIVYMVTDGLTSDIELLSNAQLHCVPMFVSESLLVYAEFSEALEELGGCFLAKTALNGDDDDSGKNIQILL